MDKKPHAKKERSVWWMTARAELPGRLGGWFSAAFGMERGRLGRLFYDGLIAQNPVLVLSLGLCSVLAMSASLQAALGLGAATTAVLVCSGLVLSLLRRLIPQELRFACSAIVIAGFSTAANLLMQAWFPALSAGLGIFVPLIAVNGLVLTRSASFAAGNPPGYAMANALAGGLGYTAVIVLLGALRELLGGGTLMGVPVFGEGFHPVGLLAQPAGGLLLLGGLMAGFRLLTARKKTRKGDEEA